MPTKLPLKKNNSRQLNVWSRERPEPLTIELSERVADARCLASGGYHWTIVRNARRREYLAALDAASADQNIRPFAEFIREEMHVDWSEEPSHR